MFHCVYTHSHLSYSKANNSFTAGLERCELSIAVVVGLHLVRAVLAGFGDQAAVVIVNASV